MAKKVRRGSASSARVMEAKNSKNKELGLVEHCSEKWRMWKKWKISGKKVKEKEPK